MEWPSRGLDDRKVSHSRHQKFVTSSCISESVLEVVVAPLDREFNVADPDDLAT